MTIRFHKVVGSLPALLEADAVYAVRTGIGFDLRITDSTGQIAHSLNSGLPGWLTPMQPASEAVPEGWQELATFQAGAILMRLLTPGDPPPSSGWDMLAGPGPISITAIPQPPKLRIASGAAGTITILPDEPAQPEPDERRDIAAGPGWTTAARSDPGRS